MEGVADGAGLGEIIGLFDGNHVGLADNVKLGTRVGSVVGACGVD